MLPEKQNVVSPDSLDELFHKEARVIEFGSTGEEAAYEKRDAQLITQIRQELKQLFAPEQSQTQGFPENAGWW